MRGRKPLPDAVHNLHGTRIRRPKINSSAPDPQGSVGDAPEWLTASETELWREVADNLPDGLLRACDRPAFGVYVSTLAAWRAFHDQLEEEGLELAEALSIRRLMLNLSSELLRRESEFGIGPASRSRVQVSPPPGESEFDRFLQRNGMGATG